MTREPLRPFLSNVMRLLDPYSFLKNAGFGKKKLMAKALQPAPTQWCPHQYPPRRTISHIVPRPPLQYRQDPPLKLVLTFVAGFSAAPVGIIHGLNPVALGGNL